MHCDDKESKPKRLNIVWLHVYETEKCYRERIQITGFQGKGREEGGILSSNEKELSIDIFNNMGESQIHYIVNGKKQP